MSDVTPPEPPTPPPPEPAVPPTPPPSEPQPLPGVTTTGAVSADPTVGQRVDAGVEALRIEVNARIDTLQARVEELSAKIDAHQEQSQSQ
jgi:hypothetical protein